jgi:hypothetical protein
MRAPFRLTKTKRKIYLEFVKEALIIPQVLPNNQAKKRKIGTVLIFSIKLYG